MIEVMILISAIVIVISVIWVQIKYKQTTIGGIMIVITMICIIISMTIEIADAITGKNNIDVDKIDEVVYAERIIENIVVDVEEISTDIEDIHFDNEYDEMIYQATKDTIIDPYLAIAISRLETGHYTSDAFLNGHNFGGMTGSNGIMSFSSKSDGLDKYITMLEWYYEMDMDTPQKMQAVYCPPNDEWDDIVSSIYNELK